MAKAINSKKLNTNIKPVHLVLFLPFLLILLCAVANRILNIQPVESIIPYNAAYNLHNKNLNEINDELGRPFFSETVSTELRNFYRKGNLCYYIRFKNKNKIKCISVANVKNISDPPLFWPPMNCEPKNDDLYGLNIKN